MTEPFERTRWVRTLPFDGEEGSAGVVVELEHTGVVRMKLGTTELRVLRDTLTAAIEESEGTRGPAHCTSRQDDGRSGEVRPAGPRLVPPRLVPFSFDRPADARRRGAIAHGRGVPLCGNPYSLIESGNFAAWAEGWIERDELGLPR